MSIIKSTVIIREVHLGCCLSIVCDPHKHHDLLKTVEPEERSLITTTDIWCYVLQHNWNNNNTENITQKSYKNSRLVICVHLCIAGTASIP